MRLSLMHFAPPPPTQASCRVQLSPKLIDAQWQRTPDGDLPKTITQMLKERLPCDDAQVA
jgi:hypothetical protein